MPYNLLTQANFRIIKVFAHVSIKLLYTLFTEQPCSVMIAVITDPMSKALIIMTAISMTVTLTFCKRKYKK